jgi:predicted aldo/keto reductase-like oxidoreductase
LKRLVLGTASFGDTYGHFEPTRIESEEIVEILNWATGRIPELDSSFDYAGSHDVIASQAYKFRVSTKLDLNQLRNRNSLLEKISHLKTKFQSNSIYRLWIRPVSIENPKIKMFAKLLNQLKSDGEIESLGASIYELAELKTLQDLGIHLDSLQVPVNLANKSFKMYIENGAINSKDFDIYARSIFLQGMLTRNTENFPCSMVSLIELNKNIQREASAMSVKPISICLNYVNNLDWVKGLVVGVQNLVELKEIYEAYREPLELREEFLNSLPVVENAVYDPRKW